MHAKESHIPGSPNQSERKRPPARPDPLPLATAEDYFTTVTPEAHGTNRPLASAPIEAPLGRPSLKVVELLRPAPALRLLPPLALPERLSRRLIFLLLAAAIALGSLWVNLSFWAPAHPGIDQNGYLVGGRMIADHYSTGYKPAEPYAYLGWMWVGVRLNTPQAEYFPKYPIGLPLLNALCLWAGPTYAHLRPHIVSLPVISHIPLWMGQPDGTTLAYLLSPICTALAVWAMFLLGRLAAGSFGGILAMILLATSQVTLNLANSPNSHASALCFVTWGVFLIVRFWQTGVLWRGILGAFLLGYAVTIRYTEGLLVLPLGIVLLSMVRYSPWSTVGWWRPLLWLIVAAAAITVRWTLKLHLTGLEAFGISLAIILITLPWSDPWNRWWRTAEWLRSFAAAGLLTILIAFDWPRSLDGIVPWTEYGSIKAALLFAIVLLFSIPWSRPRSWLTAAVVSIAWLIPVTALVVFNLRAMGTLTGYDSTNESSAFTWNEFQGKWEFMTQQVYDHGVFFITPLAVVGMAMIYRASRRFGLFLTAWFVPGLALYTAYYWGGQIFGVGYLRFFLTLFPAMILATVWLIQQAGLGTIAFAPISPSAGRSSGSNEMPLAISTNHPQGAIAIPIAAGLLVAISSAVGLRVSIPFIEREHAANLNLAYTGDRIAAKIAQPAASHAQRPIVFADTRSNWYMIDNYLQFLCDVDLYAADAFRSPWADRNNGRDQPNPLQEARQKYLTDVVFKNKSDDDLIREQHRIVQSALDAGRPVYAVLQPNWVPVFTKKFMTNGFKADLIDQWREPTPIPARSSGGPLSPNNNGFIFDANRSSQSYQILRITHPPTATTQSTTSLTTTP